MTAYPSACRSCGAPIRWVATEAGKAMPVDPDPVPDGNLEFDDGDWPRARVVDPAQPSLGDVDRYVSHFATCPDAGRWRTR